MTSYAMDDPNNMSINIMYMPVYLDFMTGQTQMLILSSLTVAWNIAS